MECWISVLVIPDMLLFCLEKYWLGEREYVPLLLLSIITNDSYSPQLINKYGLNYDTARQ